MARAKCFVLILALMAALFSGCGLAGQGEEPDYPQQYEIAPDPEYPVHVGGAVIEFRPSRIVSLAPSLTEKIYDLGHGNRLVGISDHQGDFPHSIAHLPSYGIATLPDIDGILAVRTHVVFSVSELPADAMNALADANIPLVVLPSYAHNMAQLAEIYLGISKVLDGRTTGQLIGERFMRDFNDRIDQIAAMHFVSEPMNAVYLRALDFTIATGDTLEGELMQRIGFVNIAHRQRSWVFDPEEAAQPEGQELFQSIDVMFFDENYVTVETLEQSTFWSTIDAVVGNRYVLIDSHIFERQSLRLLGQLEIMAGALAGTLGGTADDYNDYNGENGDYN